MHHFDRFESFEDHPLVNVPEAYAKANKALSNPVDPQDFENYKDVSADVAYVAQLEKQFAEEFRLMDSNLQNCIRMGRVLEAIMFEHIELSDWLGENAMTVEASRFDDIVNGVDSWVEFDEGEGRTSHLALAFDVTTSDRIRGKLARIQKEIEEGKLTRIKYFTSDRLNFKGEKTKIPRVIIGANRKTVYELADLWMKDKKRELGEHPVQFKILEEMRVQLEAFRDFSHTIGRTELEPIYSHGLEIINGIIDKKQPDQSIITDCENDDVYQEIVFGARNLKNR